MRIYTWLATPGHGVIHAMWFILAPLIAVIALATWIDWKARRRRSSARDGAAMSRDVRDARRDARAWEAGSVGHSGEDTTWMKKR